ncbi:hypothetical protein AUP07_0088 [methanogenic archaeon mixed culture ISO4-G1]|nr:hypothetical protein AUP07_0088 [methanogenic archaeon mixed culture ISO4-G1]
MVRRSYPSYDYISCMMLQRIMEQGEARASELSDIACWRAVEGRLTVLTKANILKSRVTTKGRKATVYRLTDRGLAYTKLFMMCQNIYNGGENIDEESFVVKLDELVEMTSVRHHVKQ